MRTNQLARLAAALLLSVALLPLHLAAQPAKDTATPPAPPAPAAAPPAPAAPTTTTAPPEEVGGRVVVENPYGIEALWKQGDFVARGTLIILIIMSIGTWYIGIVKYIEQARLFRDWREAEAKFWSAKSVNDGAPLLREDSAFRFMAEEGTIAVKDHSALPRQQLDLNSWLSMSLDRAIDVVNNRLQTGLAFLATVGSTAPFVGLFGTVWGIYHALAMIGASGQATLDKVAGPVGETLIMTAFGLFVAIPAVLAYNAFTRVQRLILSDLDGFAHDLHSYFSLGKR